jgi:hypothetical protein
MSGKKLWAYITEMCAQAQLDHVEILEIEVLRKNHKIVWSWRETS